MHGIDFGAIELTLRKAHEDGREMLYEHEVYSVLDASGVDVPDFVFVKDIHEVNERVLAKFRSANLMIKTVSRDMAHNQKYGGVKKVSGKDPLFIQFAMTMMREQVLSHFDEGNKPRIDGFLIIEFVKFTQALGNEIMIGLKDDPAFGCVVTLTKGGDDAEFFAKHYDPANLMIAPISYEYASQLCSSLKIRHKYDEAGHVDYPDKIAKALTAISALGYELSSLSTKRSCYRLNVLDINPMVFAEDGRFVAIDGYCEFSTREADDALHDFADISNIEKYMKPNGVAVFGVSSDATKYSMARVIVTLFMDLGREDVYCVNPKGGVAEINGKEFHLYKDFSEIENNVDMVVYAAPAKNTMLFLDSIPEDRAVVLISGIPPEMDYKGFVKSVGKRRNGIRLIGPNCMGVFNAPSVDGVHKGVNTLFIDESKLKINFKTGSNTALLTQSGAMGITMIERTQHSKILRTIVSFGNKADVNVPDLLKYFERVDDIDVISIYMEGINAFEGRLFFDLAAKSKKSIVVYKSGRTEAGAKAAASHTASMSGSYDVFRAACLQAGCVLTEDLDDFYNYTRAFAMLSRCEVKGRNVAGIVNAGLDATMGADTIYYLNQAVLADETRNKLRELNTQGLVDTNTSFLDVTPMTGDKPFAEYIRTVLADDNVDCLFVALVPHIETLKTMEKDYLDDDSLVVQLGEIALATRKPIVVSVNAGNHYQHIVDYLEDKGIPVYPNIHAAIRSLDAFVHKKMG